MNRLIAGAILSASILAGDVRRVPRVPKRKRRGKMRGMTFDRETDNDYPELRRIADGFGVHVIEDAEEQAAKALAEIGRARAADSRTDTATPA
jgi:hypothetical protein